MGMQSFRGAGGVGAISVRSAIARDAATEYELRSAAHEPLTSAEQHAHTVLAQATRAAAIVAGALVATWLVFS
jgi:hypothetical protein